MPAFWKPHFRQFLEADRERLHFAAHSHHPWPDVTLAAHQQAWLDAAWRVDEKWDHIFGEVWPRAQGHVARTLGLPKPESIVFGPNTHGFVLRLLSCLPDRPRIVTSDSEFHSFERQLRRLEEEDRVQVTRVPAEPHDTFGERLVTAARSQAPDLVFFSHVFFNSGAVVAGLADVVAALPSGPLVVVDGYHGFLAVPTDLAAIGDRAFYVAGGYKYAMAGEGACFLHVPPNAPLRPRDTGWFAAFGRLQAPVEGEVPYAEDALRFCGATFDVTPLYRFNAVMHWRAEQGLTVQQTLAHAHALQEAFVQGLPASGPVRAADLVVPLTSPHRGQFLTFRTPRAGALAAQLKAMRVLTDARDDRLRFGFGLYQDEDDVRALLGRLSALQG